MQTPAATWTAAMAESAIEPTLLVEIEADTGVTLKVLHGRSDDATVRQYPSAVREITPVSTGVHPITRKASVGSMTIDFAADGWAKSQHIAYRLLGKRVTVKSGTASLAEADYKSEFVGVIDQVSAKADGRLSLRVGDLYARLRDAEVVGLWKGWHPLEVIEDVLSKVLPAAMYDAATFDPSLDTSISHWCIYLRASTPTSALGIVDDMLTILGGCLRGFDTGVVEYLGWNAAASPVATITDDDIFEDGFEIREQTADLCNAVNLSWSCWQEKDKEAQPLELTHQVSDTAAAALIGMVGESRTVDREIQLVGLLEGAKSFQDPMNVGTLSGLCGGHSSLRSMCGGRWVEYPAAQPAWAQLSATRLSYVKMDNEILALEALSLVSTSEVTYPDHDPITDTRVDDVFPSKASFTVNAREVLGTTAASHKYLTPMHDVTIAVAVGRRVIARTAYGVPQVRVPLPLAWSVLEMGDFVYLTTSRYFDYGLSSGTTGIAWEVVDIERAMVGEDARVTVTLAQVAPYNPPAAGLVDTRYLNGTRGFRVPDGVLDRSVNEFKMTGGAISVVGLVVTFAEAYVVYGSLKATIPETNVTLRATKDNYVAFDVQDHGYFAEWVAVGAAAPTLLDHQVLVYKATTDGAGVTSSTTYTNSKGLADAIVNADAILDGAILNAKINAAAAIVGTKLAAGTGVLSKLDNTTGVLDNLTSVTTRSIDNITDGASYKRAETASRLLKARTQLTGSGTYTVPTDVTSLRVVVVGGGAGGGGASSAASSAACGSGGGSGGVGSLWITSPAASYAYACGAGGGGGSSAPTNGSDGSDTTFGSPAVVTGYGGKGGLASAAGTGVGVYDGGAGGSATGDFAAVSQSGGHAIRASGTNAVSGAGGSTEYGAGGAPGDTSKDGNAGAQGGGGGGGGLVLAGTTARAGGAGGNGIVVVEEYY